jgi:hypothetical protein
METLGALRSEGAFEVPLVPPLAMVEVEDGEDGAVKF